MSCTQPSPQWHVASSDEGTNDLPLCSDAQGPEPATPTTASRNARCSAISSSTRLSLLQRVDMRYEISNVAFLSYGDEGAPRETYNCEA